MLKQDVEFYKCQIYLDLPVIPRQFKLSANFPKANARSGGMV